ncbi:M23 family metallopeptidase [Streptomyces sp. NPDC090106]|uniref:M23 family metallopeptidase n=1 Tax=Streptomyces sp. NPDC090106 TaxID=3365946 RepID=UPI00380281E5
MDYFKQPIRPELLTDPDRSGEAEADLDADFLADADFGAPERARFRLRLRLRHRVPRLLGAPGLRRDPSRRSEPPFPGVAPSSGTSLIPFGISGKVLGIIAVGFVLVVGTVAALALSGGERSVAGDIPPPSTVTTFPAFPTASVMPPPDADEQPDGGVILAPELTGGTDDGEGEGEGDGVDADDGQAPGTASDTSSDAASDTGSGTASDTGPVTAPPDSEADEGSEAHSGSGSGAARNTGTATAPVKGYVITSSYAEAGNWTTGHHTGIDLAVPVGTPVAAVLPGLVLMASTDASYGHYVLIRHAENEYTLYAHLSRLDVQRGATVTAGQRIGLSGATGNVTGPHLHFEVRAEPVFGSDIDPVAYLAAHGVRL